jgi:hypothetical protein
VRHPIPPALGPVFLILGVLAVVWAVLAFRSERRFLSKALRATGVVESLRAERMERSTVYFPVIRFTTAAGATVTAESKTSKSSGYPIGQTISILYDPSDPKNLEIDALWSRWFMVVVAIFFALVLFGMGAATLLSSSSPPPINRLG